MSNQSSDADADIESARFKLGVIEQRWRLVRYDFPELIVAIAARPINNIAVEFGFRFDLSGYRPVAPAAQLWDLETNATLPTDQWPTGGRAALMFNPNWNKSAVYHPMDRAAQPGHAGWQQQSPTHWWGPRHHLVDYLRELWAALNASDYAGAADAA